MSPLSEDRLVAIRERRAAIDSTTPWWQREGFVWGTHKGFPHSIKEDLILGPQERATPTAAEFIAHAPEDIDYLLRAVDRLKGMLADRVNQVEQLRDLLREIQWSSSDMGGIPECPVCYTAQGTPHDPECRLFLAIGPPEPTKSKDPPPDEGRGSLGNARGTDDSS